MKMTIESTTRLCLLVGPFIPFGRHRRLAGKAGIIVFAVSLITLLGVIVWTFLTSGK